MSVEVERATLPCSVCGAGVTELRRGRCWGCYMRWAESRPVGRGAACAICGEKRRAQLKLVEIQRRSLPFCHGCAVQVMRLPDLPPTIEELRHALRRDRRDDDRRSGKVDQRIFPRERRVGERRGPGRDAFADTDPRIKMLDFSLDEVIVELAEDEVEPSGMTQVRAGDRQVPAAEAAAPSEPPAPPEAATAAAEAPTASAAAEATETPAVEEPAAPPDAPVTAEPAAAAETAETAPSAEG
jgi:hypothetical protein